MDYEVTASRKRPQSLIELTGQDFVVATLKNSIENGRIAHAYLFSGPRGVGKTSSARILARSLNCVEGPTITPCGICANCMEIARGNSLDVIEIDGASNTGVNDIREIKDEVLFSPNSSKYKIYIIDEVHMLSNSAFNALLKTIEEPPPYIIFIFATTEIHKVPATIRSRCQQFNFRLVDLSEIKRLLDTVCQELSIQFDDDALYWIARESTGSVRDAYTLFDQIVSFSEGHITLDKIQEKLGLIGLDQLNGLMKLLVEEKPEEALEYFDSIVSGGVSIEQFIIDMAEYLRNVLFIFHGIKKESLLGYTPDRFDTTVLETLNAYQVEWALEEVIELFRDIRYSINPRFELELLLSRLSTICYHIDTKQLMGELSRMKEMLKQSPVEPGYTGEKKKNLKKPESLLSKALDAKIQEKNSAQPRTKEINENSEPIVDEKPEKNHSETPLPDLSPEELKKKILLVVRKKSLSIAAGLEKAEKWIRDEGNITLVFNSPFASNLVEKEFRKIESIIENNLGWKIHFSKDIKKTVSEEKDDTIEEQVELVRSVFRGTIL